MVATQLSFFISGVWLSSWIMYTFSFSFFTVLRPKKGIALGAG